MNNNNKKHVTTLIQLGLLILAQTLPSIASSEDGVSSDTITIGGVMDLEGRSSGLGLGMKAGIEAALANQKVMGREINFITLNDSYNPIKTAASTKQLVRQKVFLFAGNVGTPTAKVALPILAENKIPAFGFFTGAGLLRSGQDDVINYRASYVQETKAVIDAALKQGIKAEGICAYVQNDAYGMAGVKGIRSALENTNASKNIIQSLDEILTMEGKRPKRNDTGPVGVYARNTFTARGGYDSLKAWEKKQGTSCRLIVTVGAYASISRFIAYANSKNERWIYSAVSFTGAGNLAASLKKFGIKNHVIMTQVVPLADSDLPIVKEARKALGKGYGYVSQEGYIVGKLLLHGLRRLESDGETKGTKPSITRDNLIATFKGQKFNLGGLEIDFSNDNQGSDLVVLTTLSNGKWIALQNATLNRLFDQQTVTKN